MAAAMDLIGLALLLYVAVAALLVTVAHALGRVLVAAVGAIARPPWRAGRKLIRAGFTRRPRLDHDVPGQAAAAAQHA
ncbi:MAG: hypothetical protein AB1679_31190 [Actinomycetota bacterium]|jgi:hypothetical protein